MERYESNQPVASSEAGVWSSDAVIGSDTSAELDRRGHRRTAAGVALALALLVALVIWQCPDPAPVHRGAPPIPAPVGIVALGGDLAWTVSGRSFRVRFPMRNVGDAPTRLAVVRADAPPSFQDLSFGVLSSGSGAAGIESWQPMLSDYTLPVGATAFVAISGLVNCPAGTLNSAPTVTMRVDGATATFDAPSVGPRTWQADVVADACSATA